MEANIANGMKIKKRTFALEKEGYKVLRFWNDQVLKETDSVLTVILETLNEIKK